MEKHRKHRNSSLQRRSGREKTLGWKNFSYFAFEIYFFNCAPICHPSRKVCHNFGIKSFVFVFFFLIFLFFLFISNRLRLDLVLSFPPAVSTHFRTSSVLFKLCLDWNSLPPSLWKFQLCVNEMTNQNIKKQLL